MRKILTLLIATTMFISCEPSSKEEYLKRYKMFIDEVSEHYKEYSADDWKEANYRHAKFRNEWYNKFKHDFTLEEKLRVAGFQVKFNGLRAAVEFGKIYDERFKDDVEELRIKIQHYVDNKMDDDLKKLLEEAKKAGKTIHEEVKKIVEEVKRDMER